MSYKASKFTVMANALSTAIERDRHVWVYETPDRGWTAEAESSFKNEQVPKGAILMLSAGYAKDWQFEEGKDEKCGDLYVLWGTQHLKMIDDFLRKVPSNLNMMEMRSVVFEERSRIVFTNWHYFKADEILRGLKVGIYAPNN